MPGISVSKICVPFGGGGIDWSSYWATLISATVENAAPTHVVLTFPAAAALDETDFTIAGFNILSGSWTGAVLTLVLAETVVAFHGNLTVTFVKTGTTATVTNNVSMANTVGWYVTGDGSATYMTKDGSNYISQWNDLSGNGNHLLQATGSRQPLYNVAGIIFDGALSTSGDYLAASFSWVRPSFIYAVIKVVTWVNARVAFDSYADTDRGAVVLSGPDSANAYWVIAQGLNFPASAVPMLVDQMNICRFLFNGANSFVKVNAAGQTGNPGTTYDINGLTIGTDRYHTSNSNIQVLEVICRSVTDAGANETAIYNYLKAKYGL